MSDHNKIMKKSEKMNLSELLKKQREAKQYTRFYIK